MDGCRFTCHTCPSTFGGETDCTYLSCAPHYEITMKTLSQTINPYLSYTVNTCHYSNGNDITGTSNIYLC